MWLPFTSLWWLELRLTNLLGHSKFFHNTGTNRLTKFLVQSQGNIDLFLLKIVIAAFMRNLRSIILRVEHNAVYQKIIMLYNHMIKISSRCNSKSWWILKCWQIFRISKAVYKMIYFATFFKPIDLSNHVKFHLPGIKDQYQLLFSV